MAHPDGGHKSDRNVVEKKLYVTKHYKCAFVGLSFECVAIVSYVCTTMEIDILLRQVMLARVNATSISHMHCCYPKYSGLVPPFIQQLW
jgi:hypothetical protein